MRSRLYVIGAAVLAAHVSMVATARAQDARCSDPQFVGAGQVGGDACQKVIDIYNYMNIQLGTLVSGGNATLAQGGSLGGLGHFAVDLRVNALGTSIPDVSQTGISLGPVGAPQSMVTSTYLVPFPVLDAAVGVFKGFPIGLTNVGGVDLLLSATVLPHFTEQSVSVATPRRGYDFGIGARIGLLQETFATPGISFTYFRRDMPTTTITATASSTSSVTVQDYKMKTTAWRLEAGKSFLVFGAVAGIGQDRYDGHAMLTYDVDGVTPQDSIELATKPTRTNAFLDVSANIALLKLVGEVGRVWGGSTSTYNTFDPVANHARWYGSLGLRVGL